jgi:hypothetical protein
MFAMAVLLVVALLIAAAVALYVAYPRRGTDVPHAPWLGEAMKKGVDSLPTIDNTAGRDAARR